MSAKIIKAYIDHVLQEGERPASVYVFAKKLKMDESKFYSHFTSFDALENGITAHFFESVIEALQNDEVYLEYSAREKYMAFLYAWVEKARENRSFLTFLDTQEKLPKPTPDYFKELKKAFHVWADTLVREGIDKQEVKFRQVLTDRYADGMFLQFIFLHRFWLKDSSPDFEKTDAAIEKSVHLAFDLMSQSAFDSAIDLAKFLVQQKF